MLDLTLLYARTDKFWDIAIKKTKSSPPPSNFIVLCFTNHPVVINFVNLLTSHLTSFAQNELWPNTLKLSNPKLL
jgi:hypothetical protein